MGQIMIRFKEGWGQLVRRSARFNSVGCAWCMVHVGGFRVRTTEANKTIENGGEGKGRGRGGGGGTNKKKMIDVSQFGLGLNFVEPYALKRNETNERRREGIEL